MSTWNKMSNEEKEMIKNLFREGKTLRQVSQISGRSKASVEKVKASMKDKISAEINKAEEVVQENDNRTNPNERTGNETIRDYRDPVKYPFHIDIRTIFKISGDKTGNRYLVDYSDKKNPFMVMRNDEGCEWKMPFEKIESLIDELIDISVEVDKIAKKIG